MSCAGAAAASQRRRMRRRRIAWKASMLSAAARQISISVSSPAPKMLRTTVSLRRPSRPAIKTASASGSSASAISATASLGERLPRAICSLRIAIGRAPLTAVRSRSASRRRATPISLCAAGVSTSTWTASIFDAMALASIGRRSVATRSGRSRRITRRLRMVSQAVARAASHSKPASEKRAPSLPVTVPATSSLPRSTRMSVTTSDTVSRRAIASRCSWLCSRAIGARSSSLRTGERISTGSATSIASRARRRSVR